MAIALADFLMKAVDPAIALPQTAKRCGNIIQSAAAEWKIDDTDDFPTCSPASKGIPSP